MIYIIKHREYNNPIPKDYIELGVGKMFNSNKDNINEYNPYLNEITGLYHIWKHVNDDIVGLCHYRRMFWNKDEEYFETIDMAKKILKDYDIIVAPKVNFDMTLYWQLRFEVEDSPILDKYIELYDDYAKGFKDYLNTEKGFHNREMFICKKELIDKYCEWLFTIAIPIADKFIQEDKGTNCNQRLVSHIIERLFDYWIKINNFKVYEMEYEDL